MATNNAINNDLSSCSNLPVPGGLNATGTPSATTFLRGDGTWNVPASSGVSTAAVQTLSSSGTYTPTSGMKFIIVEMCAGGGGSGGTSAAAGVCAVSASGSPGGYLRFMMTAAQVGASLSYSVGGGGAGGTAGANGTAGTATTFGNWTAAAGAASALGNSNNSNQAPALNGTNTVGTGTVIQNIRSSGNGGYSFSINGTFLGAAGARALGAMGGSGNQCPNVLFALSAGSGTATFSGPGYFGGGFGCGGPGTIQYSQASGSTQTNTGTAGTVGTIIVTEYI